MSLRVNVVWYACYQSPVLVFITLPKLLLFWPNFPCLGIARKWFVFKVTIKMIHLFPGTSYGKIRWWVGFFFCFPLRNSVPSFFGVETWTLADESPLFQGRNSGWQKVQCVWHTMCVKARRDSLGGSVECLGCVFLHKLKVNVQ